MSFRQGRIGTPEQAKIPIDGTLECRLNPKTAIAQGDLAQPAGREGPLSALTGTQRIRLVLPQALSASILHHLIPSDRRFRV